MEWRSELTAEQWSALVLDMERGKNHTVYVLTLKLQHWEELPWLLCILAHIDDDVARRGAARIIAKFDTLPIGVMHHRLTMLFCTPGFAPRRQLEMFASGASLSCLPGLHAEVCKLRGIPLTERCVEAPHGAVMKSTARHGPVSVTMAIRMREIQSEFKSPEAFQAIARFADCSRHMRKIPQLLGIQGHPWLRRLPKDASTHTWLSALTWVIYRCDELSQFADLSGARKRHIDSKRRQRREVQLAIPASSRVPDVPFTRASVFSHFAVDRFRACLSTDGCASSHVFSLPATALLPTTSKGSGPTVTVNGLRRFVASSGAASSGVADSVDGLEPDTDCSDPFLAPLADEVGAEARVFFRVVHAHPAMQKVQDRPAASGRNATKQQIAISLLSGARSGISPVQGRGAYDVEVSTASLDPDKSAVIAFTWSDPFWLRSNLLVHSEGHRLKYSLDMFAVPSWSSDTDLSSALESLMSEGALPGSGTAYRAKPSQVRLLQSMSAAGVVERAPGLTAADVGGKAGAKLCVNMAAHTAGAEALEDGQQRVRGTRSAGNPQQRPRHRGLDHL